MNADARVLNNYPLNHILFIAASNNYLKIAEAALESGAEIDSEAFHSDMTSLMLACRFGHIEMVRFLIQRGARLEVQNFEGRTALMLADEKGFFDIVALLVRSGAKK